MTTLAIIIIVGIGFIYWALCVVIDKLSRIIALLDALGDMLGDELATIRKNQEKKP